MTAPITYANVLAGPHKGKVITIDKRAGRIRLPVIKYQDLLTDLNKKLDYEPEYVDYRVVHARYADGAYILIPEDMKPWTGLVAIWEAWSDQPGVALNPEKPLQELILEWLLGAVGSREVVSRVSKQIYGYEMLLVEHFLGHSASFNVCVTMGEMMQCRGDQDQMLSSKFIQAAARLRQEIFQKAEQEASEKMESKYPYGFCPICGAPGTMRERRPNGNDQCERGHTYPSKEALKVSELRGPNHDYHRPG